MPGPELTLRNPGTGQTCNVTLDWDPLEGGYYAILALQGVHYKCPTLGMEEVEVFVYFSYENLGE